MSTRETARAEHATPRLPEPLTVESLRTLMRERPYWDLKHPRSALHRRLVDRGFAMLFPGKTKYDDTGKAIDVPPLPPEAVAHQVAQVNREMDRLERSLAGTSIVAQEKRDDENRQPFDERPTGNREGAVHVQAHTRDGGKTEVADYWRAAPGEGERVNFADGADTTNDENDTGNDSLPHPDSRDPVDPEGFYRKIGFDPNGEKQWQAVLRRPLDAKQAGRLETEASDIAREEYPGTHPHNSEADAFRHAYWSFKVAREIGADAAKEFGDAHERSDPNPTPERLMDLYNNKVGRDLAADSKNADRDAREVIREAIREGKLRTSPFKIDEPPSLLPDRAPGFLYPRTSGRGR
jgi:hypothetical protein